MSAERAAELDAAALRRRCDPGTLGFETTAERPDLEGLLGQVATDDQR